MSVDDISHAKSCYWEEYKQGSEVEQLYTVVIVVVGSSSRSSSSTATYLPCLFPSHSQ